MTAKRASTPAEAIQLQKEEAEKRGFDEGAETINEIIGGWWMDAADDCELTVAMEIKQALVKFRNARDRRGW